MIRHQFNDGGRAAAGYVGRTGDCVARSIAIAAELPYVEVYERLAQGNASERKSTGKKTAREGISVKRKWFKSYMAELGFRWVATMGIGTGCKVHLREDELPKGRIIVALSKHYAAVIDGVLHDTYEDSREGSRCVYGYWVKG
jgi:hypothetical protein